MAAEDDGAKESLFNSQIEVLRSFQELEVVGGKELFNNGEHGDAHRATHHIELSAAAGGEVQYVAGDHLALLPPSDDQAVVYTTQQLGIQNDEASLILLSICIPLTFEIL